MNMAVFLEKKTGRWIMSRNIIFVLMYHRHKLEILSGYGSRLSRNSFIFIICFSFNQSRRDYSYIQDPLNSWRCSPVQYKCLWTDVSSSSYLHETLTCCFEVYAGAQYCFHSYDYTIQCKMYSAVRYDVMTHLLVHFIFNFGSCSAPRFL
jgi:hypothetical protein